MFHMSKFDVQKEEGKSFQGDKYIIYCMYFWSKQGIILPFFYNIKGFILFLLSHSYRKTVPWIF